MNANEQDIRAIGERIKEILRQAHDDYFTRGDGHCKSYEGQFEISLSYPNYWEYDTKEPEWRVIISSYLFSPSGRSWHGTLAEAEAEVTRWRDEQLAWTPPDWDV